MDNKVSKKAIWEGAISPDNDTPSIGSQMQTQPQMMFCYKCNNVIPGNSTFCPYCQIKLFVECPKCGTKYSSQYPACNNCGTNREEYLRAQRREQERKEAIERENRRKRLEEERRKKEAEAERERQELLRRYEQQENERAYRKENDEIMKTKEYETTYSILSEALTALDNKKNRNEKKAFLLHSLFYIFLVISSIIDLANRNMELFSTIGIIIFLIGLIGLVVNAVHKNIREWQEEYLMQKALSDSRYTESLITTDLIPMVWYQRNLSECCLIAYRKKHKLPINYKWHNLRRD